MPQPSAIDGLTPEQRTALDRELIRRNFTDYAGLVAWAEGLGLCISRSSAHRYGQKIQRRLAAVKASTDAARLIAEAAPDDADLRSAAVISLVQSELFDVMVSLQDAAEEDTPERVKLLTQAARAMRDIGAASVLQKQWSETVKTKLARTLDRLEGEAANTPGKLDAETLKVIRRETYGLFD